MQFPFWASAVLVAAAVGLFLYSGIRVEKYGVLKEEMFWMDGATRQYMEELRAQNPASPAA